MSMQLPPARSAKVLSSPKSRLYWVALLPVLGAIALWKTPREEEPQIVVPMVDVMVGMPGATPAEVESRLARPLEEMFWEIPGVEYVYSTSTPGAALVIVRFYVGEDIERSLVKLYNKLYYNMDRMPAGATMPLVKSRSIDDVPVLALTLWSDRYDGFELRRMARELEDQVKKLNNVSETTVIGGQKRQLRVTLDPDKLAAYNLSLLQLVPQIQGANMELPAGQFERGNRMYLVETGSWITSADDLSHLVVGSQQRQAGVPLGCGSGGGRAGGGPRPCLLRTRARRGG